MKAWLVKVKDEFCATVVFAETRGKARSIAMHTDACEDVDFCDIEVRRLPHIDKYYKEGKTELDWLDKKRPNYPCKRMWFSLRIHRRILVRVVFCKRILRTISRLYRGTKRGNGK